MKSLRFLLAFLMIGTILSCTDNDKPLKLSELTLQYDAESTNIPVQLAVGFTLKGNDYMDYTEEMELVVNGEAVEGSIYVFDQTGEYEVKASAKGMSSNTINFTVSEGLIVSRNSLLKNQVNKFTLYDVSTGENISDEGIFYVNDEPIAGNEFSSSSVGEYQVYAEYTSAEGDELTTDTYTFTVVTPVQRILVEDYTGTWCGYCPRLQSVIEEAMDQSDLITSIAIHKSSSDSNPDPYEYENIDPLVEEYNPYGEFPKGLINRTIGWSDNDPNTLLDYVGDDSDIGIAIKTKVSGSTLNVDVRVASTTGFSNKKIVVAALENLLYHDQTSYLNDDPDSPWYQAGNPIPDYENNHVLHHAMTNIFGDAIPATDALNDYKKSYSMDMSDYYENQENGEVVVFILDDNGTVLQVQEVGLNDVVEFQ